MSEAYLKRGIHRLRDGISAFADFLARLSSWQFVGLCVLLLIATGITEDMLSGDRGKVHKTFKPIVVEQSSRPASADFPGQPEEPQTDPDKKIEIRIDEAGIVVSGSPDLERLGKKLEEHLDREPATVAGEEDLSHGIELPQLAVLLIVLMLIVRLVSKSKLKAEAATVAARDLAEREALLRQLAEARLQAMQAQVEPHFLFNTLAAVEHLIETDPPRAAQMQRSLIGYLRSVLPKFRKPDSTLGREVEISRHYLDILKMRMEDRLQIDISIPEALAGASMPPMMLQSLVENAIRHGLEPKPEGGHLYLRAAASEGILTISVIDTGIGYDPDSKPAGGGLGLSNIRERLAALYGPRGRLVIAPNLPHGTQVRIELPYEGASA